MWTWGKHFFEDSEIDMKAYMALDSTKMENLSWEEMPKKYTSKTVNFCPYCRALVGATITAPFVYLWRLFPHKKKEPLTREGIKKAARRRTITMLLIVFGINGGLATKNLIYGEFIQAAVQIGIISFVVVGFKGSAPIGKALMKLSDWIAKHRKPKVKVKKVKIPKKPSKLKQKLVEKHNLICPPIFFVDVKDPEKLR